MEKAWPFSVRCKFFINDSLIFSNIKPKHVHSMKLKFISLSAQKCDSSIERYVKLSLTIISFIEQILIHCFSLTNGLDTVQYISFILLAHHFYIKIILLAFSFSLVSMVLLRRFIGLLIHSPFPSDIEYFLRVLIQSKTCRSVHVIAGSYSATK